MIEVDADSLARWPGRAVPRAMATQLEEFNDNC